jgi:hypothetical protein
MSNSNCINITHPEWKKLVKQLDGDEDLAKAINLFHQERNIPFSKYFQGTTELKKAVLFKRTVSWQEMKNLQHRIGLYNNFKNTSHGLPDGEKVGQADLYKVELIVNYLPKNIERGRLRDSQRSEDGVIRNKTFKNVVKSKYFKAFEATNNEKIEIPFEKSLAFYNNDKALQEQEEGFGVDYLLSSAPDTIKSQETLKKDFLHKQITQQRRNLAKFEQEGNVSKVKEILNTLEELKVKLNKSEKNEKILGSLKLYEGVLQFADIELNHVAKMLENPALSSDDVQWASKVVKFWIQAGDFSTSPAEHLFLDAEEFESETVRKEFKERQGIAEKWNNQLTAIKEQHLVEMVKQYTDKQMTAKEILKALKDTNKITADWFWGGRSDDTMIQVIAMAIERANFLAQQEANKVWKKLDEYQKQIKGKEELFKQKTKEGLETGLMINLFSPEFFDKMKTLRQNAFYQRDAKTGEKINDPAAFKAYNDFLDANTIMFDARKLIPDVEEELPKEYVYSHVKISEAEKEEHIKELKRQLGEKEFDKYYAKLENQIKRFQTQRLVTYDRIQLNEDYSEFEKDQEMNNWLKKNSPYWAADMKENPSMRYDSNQKFINNYESSRYTQVVPLRFDKNNNQTDWYDPNFSKIQQDENLYNFHDYFTSTLLEFKSLFPESVQKNLGVNVIPYLKKTIADEFSEKGLFMGFAPLQARFVELTTTTDLSKIATEGDKKIQLQFIEDNKEEVKSRTAIKLLGKVGTLAERIQARKEVLDEMSKEKSWDLIKIMKAYSLMALGYKHKSVIEPQIKIAEELLKERKELKVNKGGQVQKKKNNTSEDATDKGLVNRIAQAEFMINADFYNMGSRKVEGASKTKQYTLKEKKYKKELEQKLEEADNEEDKALIRSEIEKLGAVTTASGVVDTLLKYNTQLSLGWNIPSSMNNLVFGITANYIEASDGRIYNTKELNKAYLISTNSIAKNLSFDKFDGVNKNALKTRSLMDKWDILKTTMDETYSKSSPSAFSKLGKRFGPMSLTQKTEYMNQAPVVIAMLLRAKATSPTGEEVTLWEAYDEEGNIKEGYSTKVDEIRYVQKIRRTIEKNHSDYRNTLKGKQFVLSRMFSQFRTWIPEGFAGRFESEKVDEFLSYENGGEDYIRKGRYRSYTKGQLATTGATLGSLFLPGIGTIVGATGGYLIGKFVGLKTDQTAIGDVTFTLKQLLRKAMFQKTQFDEKFSKEDAAAMRKNMTELYIMVGLSLALLALANAVGDDDEEEKNFMATILMNQGNRLVTDIEFYTNPMSMEKITKSALPATRLIDASTKFFKATFNQLDGDPENNEMGGGSFEGINSMVIRGMELFPGLNAGLGAYKAGDRLYEN